MQEKVLHECNYGKDWQHLSKYNSNKRRGQYDKTQRCKRYRQPQLSKHSEEMNKNLSKISPYTKKGMLGQNRGGN